MKTSIINGSEVSRLSVAIQIESEAESLLSTIKSVLGLAHKGIIQSAIDCSLDSDMTQLDLIGMVELGSEIEDGECAGGGYAA
ncbi:hypothetical protein MO408_28025 (plasmid) [Klebsiella pneumoniae]|nr:hypothetical protein MO408_28025 [Klebsiella pneumoniae]